MFRHGHNIASALVHFPIIFFAYVMNAGARVAYPLPGRSPFTLVASSDSEWLDRIAGAAVCYQCAACWPVWKRMVRHSHIVAECSLTIDVLGVSMSCR